MMGVGIVFFDFREPMREVAVDSFKQRCLLCTLGVQNHRKNGLWDDRYHGAQFGLGLPGSICIIRVYYIYVYIYVQYI